jgi:hypothetical protein
MEFITKLVERNPEQLEEMKKLGVFMSEEERTRILQGIIFGDFYLSIQASYYHYCQPRLTMELDMYSSMEMAVIKNVDGKGIWTNLEDDEIFSDFTYVDEFKNRNDSNGLYGYLDVQLIEELYQYLKGKFTEQSE